MNLIFGIASRVL